MRIDTHIHTDRSVDGVERPTDILAHVRQSARLDAIAFTDHNVQFPRKMAEQLTREYGILVIPGIEIGDIRSGKHIVALNLDEADEGPLLRRKSPEEILDYIAAQGGLSIAAHPTRRGYGNFYEMRFDAVEVANGGCGRRWRQVENLGGLPEIGCSDAHIRCHVGRAWTEVESVCPGTFDGRTLSGTIRHVTDDVIESLRQGLCHASSPRMYDPRYFEYGLQVGKKYVGKSLTALKSLVT